MNNTFTAREVYDAYERIKNYIYKTPLEESLYLGTEEQKYFFKLESTQTVKASKSAGR